MLVTEHVFRIRVSKDIPMERSIITKFILQIWINLSYKYGCIVTGARYNKFAIFFPVL